MSDVANHPGDPSDAVSFWYAFTVVVGFLCGLALLAVTLGRS